MLRHFDCYLRYDEKLHFSCIPGGRGKEGPPPMEKLLGSDQI